MKRLQYNQTSVDVAIDFTELDTDFVKIFIDVDEESLSILKIFGLDCIDSRYYLLKFISIHDVEEEIVEIEIRK